jgi:hypothetical protein
MKNTFFKFFLVAFCALTMSDVSSNSCNMKSKKGKSYGCEEGSCGAKNVRQHRFAKSDCCPRKMKSNQKKNRKAKSCCN